MIIGSDVGQLFDQAVADHRAGKLAEAGSRYDQILQLEPGHADAMQLYGLIAHQCGDHAAALVRIGRAIELDGSQAVYYCNYGNALQASGRVEEAERSFRRAIELQPGFAEAHNNLASLLKEQGRLEQAVASYQEAVRLSPGSATLHLNLAMTYHAMGRLADAASSFERAIELEPESAGLHNALAQTLAGQGRPEPAIVHFRRAVDLAPDVAELHCNLGAALNEAGALQESAETLRRAIALDPELPQAHYNLGTVLLRQSLFGQAVGSFQAAIDLAPGHAEAHVNMGMALWRKSELTEARIACECGLAINPGLPEGHVILGNVLKDLGAAGEAIAHYRRALELRPDDLVAHANLIFSLHYLAGTRPAAVVAEIVEWNRRHTASIHPAPPRQPGAGRKQRISIGYVSANLRTHPGGFFLGAVLAAHDRDSFEVSCYVDTAEEDEHSRRIQVCVDRWQPIITLTDEALAERIREDEIDILVDMNRFSGSCRLRAFARKPAPVQVTWMGGPITTTGLASMDYVLTDAVHTPLGGEAAFVEEVIRLDNAYAIYQPPPYAPPVGPLPALENLCITFGCFNYLAKLQPEVIRLWAAILSDVPGSRMFLQSKAFADQAASDRIIEQFSRHGIDRTRVILRGGISHSGLLALYGEVDVALDPFPYSGGITTCEALWMGVPVITMPGPVVPVRHSVSHLANAGLHEWIAAGPEAYRAYASAIASDVSRLAGVRAGLRERISTSPLCDAARFTRRLEDAYRAMWRRVTGGLTP